MKRVTAIKPAGEWDAAAARDSIVLDAQDRYRRRVVFVGGEGATYLLDLPRPAQLRDGDALVIEDGALVRVTGKPESLMEIAAPNAHALARLAWHIGNRHTEMQIVGDRLRIRRDHVLEKMLRGLGATLTYVDAVFDPEHGAYAQDGHGHGSGHGQ
jgi:urease accessory protein